MRSAIIAAVAATTASGGAFAQLDEIVVTATKRPESMQDIPVAVQALGEDTISDFGISNFTDYLIQLPGLTAGGSGPGQNTIYIRGLASTTPNLTTAGVAGLAPNVALYLDEQALAQPGRNLDVYTADMSRIEVLAGPQGTLFGASSQAGTVRLITNRPDPTGTYANLRMGSAFTKGGDPSHNVEGMLNVPINEQLTLRGVIYVDRQGGYIDNVPGTRDASEGARFRPADMVRANGVPVSADRAGFQAGADLSDVTFLEADNSNRTKSNFNDTTYAGGRLSALYDINPDWSILVSHTRQTLDADGVFFADPNLDDMEIQRFEDDSLEDEFHNTAWTIEGRVADLEVLYTGAYTDRDTDQVIDYTDYIFAGQYHPYYTCDGSVTYPGSEADGTPIPPSGVCQPPNSFVKSTTRTKVQTHEIRINTPAEKPIRATLGAFYSDLELKERNDFTYLGSIAAEPFGPFAPNFPFPGSFASDPGPFPPAVIFRNDIKRTDKQWGAFGEVTWDMTEQFAVTLGARYYDIDVDFEGTANGSFCNSGAAADQNAFGTNISDLFDGSGEFTFVGSCNPALLGQTFSLDDSRDDIQAQFFDAFIAEGRTEADAMAAAEATAAQVFNSVRAPDKASTSGWIGKVSLSWRPMDNALIYATYSQGFRPGLLNRPGGAQGPQGFSVPFALDTDDVDNWEIGWKLELLDNTLRFNGSAFYVEIDKLQTTIFDPSITNLFFSDNAADAEIRGVEGDFIWVPTGAPGLTLGGAFSFLDTKITNVITPTDDVREGDRLAFAPKFQGNLRARYEWPMESGMTGHVMPYVTYSSAAFSDIIVINRDRMSSWTMFGITAGVSQDNWTAELYVENLFDKRAELARNFVFDRERVTYARPRTAGIRLSYGF
ncbi:MAG: TonB-dependent receptor [Gammaproteobacteria bacterium]|nr:TonB-dependent receptor [Gammaproteobacteria bacterium]